jgi:4-carboxymuconolactone decarboxylase
MVKLPFNPDSLSAKDRTIYEEIAAKRRSQGAPFDGPYAALMNHPELCQKMEALGYYLKFQGHLSREVYQFVVLSVAKETKSAFEWSDHVEHALAAGVSEAVIESIKANGVLGKAFPEPYQLAAQVLNATLAWKNIPEQVQADAINYYGLHGFIEIVVLSGFYQMFSAINQGFDVSKT